MGYSIIYKSIEICDTQFFKFSLVVFEFLFKDVLELGASRWHTTVETSLNVPRSHLEVLFPFIDEYIVDIKDMNPEIYNSYTGQSNDLVINNLRWLVEKGLAKRILCRIPLIQGYNDVESQRVSQYMLLQIGIERSELFTYKT